MRVLLTGGAGFVGLSVHDQLATAGHAIRVFDRVLDRQDNLIDHDRLAAAASGCDAVIHLAARSALGSTSVARTGSDGRVPARRRTAHR